MKVFYSRFIGLVVLILLGLAPTSKSFAYRYVGKAGTLPWAATTSWTTNNPSPGFPGASDTAIIPTGSTITVSLTESCLLLSVTGTLNFLSNVTLNVIAGDTLNSGGSINPGATTNSINITGYFVANGGTINKSNWTVSGASTFNGVVTFNSAAGTVAFSGTSVFNNGSGISFTATRGSTFTFGGAVTTNGTVSISGTSLNPVVMSSTLTVSAASTLSMSNTSDAITGAVTVNGTLTFTGSALAAVTMANTLTIAAGATFNIASASLVVSGTTTVNGSIVFNDASVPKTFATVTVAATGTWNCSGYDMFFKFTGSLTNLGTFKASATSTGPNEYKFTGAGVTINGTLTIPHLNENNPGPLTNTGTLTITDSLYGNGTFVQGNNSVLDYDAPYPIAVNTFTAYTAGQTDTVDYDYNGAQTIRGNNGYIYSNLTCSNSGTKSLSNNVNIAGNLTIQNAAALDVTSAGSYNITVYGNWIINSSNATPFIPEQGKVTFDGITGVQALTTNVAAGQTFYDVTYNNTSASSPNITTNANINVTDNTNFNLGTLDLQGHNYIITPGSVSTTDNFNAGSIITSVAGSNINATDPNKVKQINFSGTAIGTAAHGITFNVTAGRIQFTNFTEYGTASFTKTLNIDDVFGGGNYYHGPVTFTAAVTASRWRMGNSYNSSTPAVPDTFWNATFIANADSATGSNASLNNNFIVGANSLGNAFYGTTHMTSITSGGFYVCRQNDTGAASCEFHGPVIASIDYTGNMTFANSAINHPNVVVFDSSITLNSTALSTGYYNFANSNVYGKVILNSGAQFLTGSINGKTNTYLNNVTQNGPLKQTINTSGSTGALYIGGVTALPAYKCTFNGPCNFTADTAGYFVGSTFNDTTNITVNHPNANGYLISDTFRVASTAIVGDLLIQNNYFGGTVTLQHTSSFSSLSNGGNTFNGNAIVQNQGTGTFRMGDFGGLGDTYYGTINFVQNGGGTTQPAYGLPSYFNGNISVAGSTGAPVAFGTGGGTMVVESSGGIQTFSNGTAPIPAIGNLTMNTLVAGSVLQFNFSATVSGILNMIQGIINLNGNTLTLGTSIFTPGTLLCPAPPAITGWIFGGTFARWMRNLTTIPLPNTTSVATGGFFPMGSNLTQLDFEPFWFSGTTSTGGIISVSQPSTAVGITPIATYTDLSWGSGTPVGDITNASWKVTTGATTLSGTAKLVYGGFGFEPPYAYPYNSNASNATSATGSYATPLQLYGTNDIEVERTNLSLAQIAANNWYIGLEIPPAPVAGGTSPVCSGGTINLTASSITGASYTWTGPNGFVSHSQDTTLTNVSTLAAGTYSVTATVGTITGPAGTVTIVVNLTPPAPVATSNSPVCTGTTLQLNASNVGSVTYSWTGPNGFTSALQNPSITNVTLAAAGTYSVVAKGTVGGCLSTTGTTTVVIKSTPATPAPTSNSPLCGDSTLKLSTTTVGSATYSWTGPNTFSSALQNPTITNATTLNAGIYSLTVTVNGCTSGVGNTTVTVYPTMITPVASSNTPVCTGTTLNLSTALVAGASYSWKGPNSFSSALQDPSISNVTLAAAGTYSLAIKVSGCPSDTGTTLVVVNQTPATPAPTNNSPICSGNTLNLFTSAVGGATYSWTGPNSFSSSTRNPSIANAPVADAGTYSVTVTVTGCTSTAGTTLVTINPTPTAPTAGSNSPVCAGSTLNLTATSTGTNYSWTGPNGFTSTLQNPSITNATSAATGTYTVTSINLPSGCTSAAATVSVIVSKLTPVLTTIAEVKCNGSSTGEATVSVTGGITPYTYSWTSGATTDTASGLSAGIYTVTVTDVDGCICTAIDTIKQPTPIAPVTAENPATCGVNNGSVSVTVTGGIPSYTYLWSSGQNTTAVNNLLAGNYYVVVTDANACFDTAFVIVTNANGPNPYVKSVTDVTCNGGTNGAGSIGISGGTTPYTFQWLPSGGTDSIATGLTAGSYTVDVRDANNCLNIAVVNVTQPLALKDTTTSQTNVTCNGGDNGKAVILTSGGVPAYTYSWSNSVTIDSASNLTAGKYAITVMDSHGCSVQDTVTILQPAPITKNITASQNPICYGDSAILSAGTAISYLWSTGATTDSITVKPAATTPYTVYQTSGTCKDTVVETVVVYGKLKLTMPPMDSVCFGNATQVGVVVTGGKPIFNYAWNNGLANGPGPYSVKPTQPITYVCTVTDGCGESATDSTMIVGSKGIKASFYASPDTAASGQPIAFINTTKGGNAWLWTFGDGSMAVDSFPNHSFATSGDYQVWLLVTSKGGCTDSVSETVYITAPFIVPNVFTPNGDGINDVFHVSAGAMQSYSINIFNRWGEVVFSANNSNIDWSGYTDAGLIAPSGTYFYKLNAVDNKGTAYNLSGSIELIR